MSSDGVGDGRWRRAWSRRLSHLNYPSCGLRTCAFRHERENDDAEAEVVVAGFVPPVTSTPPVGTTMSSWQDVICPSMQLDPVALARTGYDLPLDPNDEDM